VGGAAQAAAGRASLLTLAIVTRSGRWSIGSRTRSSPTTTVLVLLIVSVGVHFALTGLGSFLGAEGFATELLGRPFLGGARCRSPARRIFIFLVSIALIVALFLFFERTCAARRCARPRSNGSARG
jgi:branched-chain amino acid transport system permease protein